MAFNEPGNSKSSIAHEQKHHEQNSLTLFRAECYPHAIGRTQGLTSKMDFSAAIRFRGVIGSAEVDRGEERTFAAQQLEEIESDDQLFLRVECGEKEALAVLFRRYAATVYHIGKRILQDAGEADDLVQEVFLYIHRKNALFDSSKGSARSWIIQVAYTQALLRRRDLKGHGFYVSGITDRMLETEQSSSNGADYDRTVEGLFGRDGWKRIVDDLTEDQRETLRLHFFEGYTFSEIAEKLGQSYVNVRNHHYRGLEKLRKHLREHELNRR
jgi:RNA polymerase sigma-70 factor (ECF subfamily)